MKKNTFAEGAVEGGGRVRDELRHEDADDQPVVEGTLGSASIVGWGKAKWVVLWIAMMNQQASILEPWRQECRARARALP
jgi:hypothetical protein